MKAWHVYFKGRWLDTVFYTHDCGAEYVKRTLVNHDGYPPGIVVLAR